MIAKKLPDIEGRDERGEYIIYSPTYPRIDWGDRDSRNSKYQKLQLRIMGRVAWPITMFCFMIGAWTQIPAIVMLWVWIACLFGLGFYAEYAAKKILIEEADAKYLKECQEFEQLRKKIADESKKLPIP